MTQILIFVYALIIFLTLFPVETIRSMKFITPFLHFFNFSYTQYQITF